MLYVENYWLQCSLGCLNQFLLQSYLSYWIAQTSFLDKEIVMSSFVFLNILQSISFLNLFRSTLKIASFILVQSTIILLLYYFNSIMHCFLTLIFPLLLQTEDGSHHIYTAQSRALMMANKILHLSRYYLSYLTWNHCPLCSLLCSQVGLLVVLRTY